MRAASGIAGSIAWRIGHAGLRAEPRRSVRVLDDHEQLVRVPDGVELAGPGAVHHVGYRELGLLEKLPELGLGERGPLVVIGGQGVVRWHAYEDAPHRVTCLSRTVPEV
jgi:hypothetical protein